MMKKSTKIALGVAAIAALLAGTSLLSAAETIQGTISNVNPRERSFEVQGKNIVVAPQTSFKNGLRNFSDLQVGQNIKVDTEKRQSDHVARAIGLAN